MKLSSIMPPAFILKAILVRGGAFKAVYDYWGEGAKERFFFVANNDPERDDTIVLLTCSTQIERRRAHHGPRSDLVLVTVDVQEYPELQVKSVIDCDCRLIKRPRATFESQATARQYSPLPRLPNDILERVRRAVSAARTLSMAEKRLILGPDPDPGD